MLDVFASWSRLLRSGLTMTGTGLRTWETLGAANEVVAARMAILGAAMGSPLTGDHAELARMVPEKVDAFSRVGSATVSAWWAAQAAWTGQMQHLGAMALRGRMPTSAELADLGDRVAALTLGAVEAQARLGVQALAPVHRKATANARRLRRKTARPG